MKVLASLGLILALSGCANNVEKETKIPEISQKSQHQLNDKLFKAILDNDLKATRQSLKEGADVNAEGVPIVLAAGEGRTEIVELLLEKGANINAKMLGMMTALIIASMNGHLGTVKSLLNHGADINAVNGVSGDTALTTALHFQQKEIAEFLINEGANINVHNVTGLTPLMLAAVHEYTNIVELLISKKADINAKDCKGSTVLDNVEFLLTHKEITIFGVAVKLNTDREKLIKIKKILRDHGAKFGSELK